MRETSIRVQDAERRTKIEALFRKARIRSRALHEVLYSLCRELEGLYRAGQYAEMADNDLDGTDNWLDEAEEELRRWQKEYADE